MVKREVRNVTPAARQKKSQLAKLGGQGLSLAPADAMDIALDAVLNDVSGDAVDHKVAKLVLNRIGKKLKEENLMQSGFFLPAKASGPRPAEIGKHQRSQRPKRLLHELPM